MTEKAVRVIGDEIHQYDNVVTLLIDARFYGEFFHKLMKLIEEYNNAVYLDVELDVPCAERG